MKVTLKGMEDVDKQMARIERGLARIEDYDAWVFSKLPYAYGIHEGRHEKSGKLARKAGGSFYIKRALDDVLADGDRDLAEGLDKVTAPGPWMLRRIALWTRRLARKNAPRGPKTKTKNYRLWRSIKHEMRKK